ncbi:MAG: glycosyltransferase family 2 protein [Chitinophagia bacterium]|nr:glycosyltransferase family 2 protein [Chitinophagia bacterium]
MEHRKTNLILVIPVYNEQDCIEEVITSWGNFLTGYLKNETFNIIVVNDGSKDSTPTILDNLAKKVSYLIPIHQKNGGHGDAVLNGYAEAVKHNPDWVFQVDSDNQFLPDDFPKLWENRTKSKFILGYRKKRYDEFNRLIITRIVRLLLFMLYRVAVVDSNIPYRLIKGNYLPLLLNDLPGRPFAPNIFLSVMARKDGNDIMSIPVTHKERETGQVSIIKWKLLKVCFRSASELLSFAFTIKKRNISQL